MNTNNFEFKFITSIEQISAQYWNDVINTDYPFIQHEFLHALELSGSVCSTTGWQPSHLLAYSNKALVGVIPLYAKDHSYGEYVFDFQWANAYHQSGLHYYPKLVCAIPFTPCSGPRICVKPKFSSELIPLMLDTINHHAKNIGVSSWHLLFPEKSALNSSGFQADVSIKNNFNLMERLGMQYHWFNKDYNSFDDFLSRCKMKQRKNIKRERKRVEQSGIILQTREGSNISQRLWERFYYFYQRTYAKRSGNRGYLTQSFFEMLGQTIPSKIMMVTASQNKDVIAASLFFKGNDVLYGRYWGALDEYSFLHFEACYYQGIDYCISQGINHFDAGAQGEHKISRGFEPIETYSYHWIHDERFRVAIKNFVNEEGLYIQKGIKELAGKLPFKT